MDRAVWLALSAQYRQVRKEVPPDVALGILRIRLQSALDLLIAAGRPNAATDLEVLLGYARVNHDMAAGRRMKAGRQGDFWRTGKFKGPLRFTVRPTGDNEGGFIPRVCESAGCAIKHALFALQLNGVYEVLITDTRTDEVRLIDRATTMAQLNVMSWPVD